MELRQLTMNAHFALIGDYLFACGVDQNSPSLPENFGEDIPTSVEVIGLEAQTMNFKQNFKFSRLIFWGTPVPVGVCAR